MYRLRLNDIKTRGGRWFAQRAHRAHTKFWLAVLSFTESSFFLIPPDVLLIAILLAGAERWIYYSLFTAAFSVLGALFGYFMGGFLYDLLGEKIISFYHLQQEVKMVADLFGENTFWVMFFASFTPIPYKVFVLTGGFLRVNLVMFIIASAMGRGLRFLMVSFIVKSFRPSIIRTLFRYFNIITYAIVALVLVWFLFKFGLLPF